MLVKVIKHEQGNKRNMQRFRSNGEIHFRPFEDKMSLI